MIKELARNVNSAENTLQYRPDIDGLRAIAVLSVILYHVGFETFSGGFVAVDIFFVISGYLITDLIVKEIKTTGKFQFGHFYVRRARRLFPALFATLVVSTIISAILLSPGHLERFGGALIHAIASIYNVYFWLEADYFDATDNVKPLLHTWSLSVEEQFYLIWPAFLLLMSRLRIKHVIPIGLIILAIGSLSMNYA